MKTKEEMKKISNELATKYGNEILLDLVNHLNCEDKFDPDGNCGIWSCDTCGACGSWEGNLAQNKGEMTYKGNVEEGDKPEYLWSIECYVCGAKYQKEGFEAKV